MSREFPDITWEVINRITGHIKRRKQYIHITTDRLCTRCNNGWMARLEDVAKPILAPMMHGTAVSLDPLEQLIIGTWLFKTAVMYDLHSEQYGKTVRPCYFEKSEHRLLMQTGRFNTSYQLFAGEYRGTQIGFLQEDHSGITVVERDTLTPVSDPVRVYAFTLAIKRLILQISCVKIEDGSFYIRDFTNHYVQLSVTPGAVTWPPPKPMGEKTANTFAHRWSDIRIPPDEIE
jgi:hypothetical protein